MGVIVVLILAIAWALFLGDFKVKANNYYEGKAQAEAIYKGH